MTKGILLLLCGLAIIFPGAALAQNGHGWGHSEVSPATHHDVSPPLRDIPPVTPRFIEPHEAPRPIPLAHAET